MGMSVERRKSQFSGTSKPTGGFVHLRPLKSVKLDQFWAEQTGPLCNSFDLGQVLVSTHIRPSINNSLTQEIIDTSVSNHAWVFKT